MIGIRADGASSFLQRLDDPGYLLPGEGLGAASLDLARRWAQTYDSLTRFELELLEQCQKVGEKSGSQAMGEIRESDLILLEVQVSRFQLKRDYWRIRATELGGRGRNGGSY